MFKLKLLGFDLDGTLSLSKSEVTENMANILTDLLNHFKLAIISGGDLPQFEIQVVNALKHKNANLENLLLLPTCGSKFFYFENGELKKLYSEDLSIEDKKRIFEAFEKAIEDLNLKPEIIYGDQIEDRGTQVTFSALGQNSPYEVKSVWDIDMEKRKKIKEYVEPLLPDYSIHIAGKSSVDVTRQGIDKEYGMRKLIEYSGFSTDEILFFGDKLVEGGNDYPVVNTGVICRDVIDENDTEKILQGIIDSGYEYGGS